MLKEKKFITNLCNVNKHDLECNIKLSMPTCYHVLSKCKLTIYAPAMVTSTIQIYQPLVVTNKCVDTTSIKAAEIM